MLNKKECVMLELVKLNGDVNLNLIERRAIEDMAEWIIQSGEAYQQELEEAERLIEDEAMTLDLDSGEL